MERTHYMKPYTADKQISIQDSNLATIRTTTIKEATIKDPTVLVPVKAATHPAGLRELSQFNSLTAIKLGIHLTTLLYSRKQNNAVTVSQRQLSIDIKASIKAVNAGLALLQAGKFIIREGKQIYRISPKLAWFGYQLDWAIELKKLKVAGELSEAYYSIHEPIDSYTIEVGVEGDNNLQLTKEQQ